MDRKRNKQGKAAAGEKPAANRRKPVLTARLSKREIERARPALRRHLEELLPAMSLKKWQSVGAKEEQRDTLAELIEIVGDFLASNGYRVPSNSSLERSPIEQKLWNDIDGLITPDFRERLRSGAWREVPPRDVPASLVEQVVRHMDIISRDPEALLSRAYCALLYASEQRAQNRLATAFEHLAMGAAFLARGIVCQHAAGPSAGGDAKARNNPAKAESITASKILWQEREDGKHPKLRTEEQFALEVMRRWPLLSSISATKGRSTKWREEARKRK
jgi:hypothetical protein